MSAALVLLAYATVLAVLGPRLLGRAVWPERSPRLGIIAWQAMSFSALVSVVLAGLALVIPSVRVSADLAQLLAACVMALREQYAAPGGAAVSATGSVLALVLVGRAAWCVGRELLFATILRARHRDTLDVVGARSERLGVVVLDHDAPSIYCLPGRRRRIVVTAGALRLLDDEQLTAALAHEQAHLAERHDVILAWSAGLARAFPKVRLFQRAHAETVRLVEMLADDLATHSIGRLTLAEALLTLAPSRAPAATLGAGGSTAACRARRLIAPPRPLGWLHASLGSTAAAVILALPLLALAGPAAASSHLTHCPLTTTASTITNQQ